MVGGTSPERRTRAGRWLAIEGLVGAGKTTTAELLSRDLNVSVVLENAHAHPFLHDYYSEPRRFGLETELAFMALHLHKLKLAANPACLISDFSPAKNLIFGEISSSPREVAVLQQLDEALWRDFGRPDICVFLDVPPNHCRERVLRRGRELEMSLTADDLVTLRAGYLTHWSTLGQHVIRIDLTGNESAEAVAAEVAQHLDHDTGVDSGPNWP